MGQSDFGRAGPDPSSHVASRGLGDLIPPSRGSEQHPGQGPRSSLLAGRALWNLSPELGPVARTSGGLPRQGGTASWVAPAESPQPPPHLQSLTRQTFTACQGLWDRKGMASWQGETTGHKAKTAPGGERAPWGRSGRVRPEGFLEAAALGSGWKDGQDWLVLCPASVTRMTYGTG